MKITDKDLTDMARFAPPYTYAVAVAVGSADQTFTGYKIVALQSTTAGIIKVDLPDASGVSISIPAGAELRGMFTKIYSSGTDAGLQTGKITALGFMA